MNPFETTVAVDPNLSFSLMNVTTSGKKAGQSDGIPIPLGLQPPEAQNQVFNPSLFQIIIPFIQVGPADQGNYETTRSHVDILQDQRDRAQAEYHTAKQAWETFQSQAKDWTIFTNRIHRTEDEEKLVNLVSYSNFQFSFT